MRIYMHVTKYTFELLGVSIERKLRMQPAGWRRVKICIIASLSIFVATISEGTAEKRSTMTEENRRLAALFANLISRSWMLEYLGAPIDVISPALFCSETYELPHRRPANPTDYSSEIRQRQRSSSQHWNLNCRPAINLGTSTRNDGRATISVRVITIPNIQTIVNVVRTELSIGKLSQLTLPYTLAEAEARRQAMLHNVPLSTVAPTIAWIDKLFSSDEKQLLNQKYQRAIKLLKVYGSIEGNYSIMSERETTLIELHLD